MKLSYTYHSITLLLILFTLSSVNLIHSQNDSSDFFLNPNSIEIGDFNELKVYSGIIVNLIPSDENRLEIYGDRYGGIIAKEKGNTLKIKMRLSELIHYNNAYVDLYYKRELNSIKLHQGARVDSKRPLKNNKMVIKVHEGASFKGEIKAMQLISRARTGGSITLYGKVKEHQLRISSGGICEAEDLITEYSDVKIFTGGNADIYSENNIDAQVSMGGEIRIIGNPKKVYARRTIAGEIYRGNSFTRGNKRHYRFRTNKNYN